MKKLVFILALFFLLGSLCAQSHEASFQQTQRTANVSAVNHQRGIELDQIIRLAADFTSVMWEEETLYPAEPLPLYGPDDQVIAYELNFSFREEFPDLEEIKSLSDASFSISRDAGFGVNDYAYVIVGATRDMPVIIESSKCLSHTIVDARQIEREAAKLFSGDHRIGRTYYLGAAQIWTLITDGKENRYINPFPFPMIISEDEYNRMITEEVMFWERDEFDEEWDTLLGGIHNLRDSPVMIPGEQLMPFYEWTYGCTPSAGAMIFSWWDHYRGTGRMNAFHFSRYEPIINNVVHHTPNTTRILADKMGTWSYNGATIPWNMADGMDDAAQVWGYTCNTGSMYGLQHTSSALYSKLKDVIDAEIPALTNIWKHSNTAVGYWNDPKLWFSHDTHSPSLKTFHRSALWGVFWSNVTDYTPTYFEIVQPDGGKEWFSNVGGEILVSGNVYEISWAPHSHPNTYVQAYYHIEGGDPDFNTWIPISTNSPNNGMLNWMVPDITSVFGNPATTSEFCRVRIRLRDSNTHALLAEDGSYGNFTITDDGPGMPWVQIHNQQTTGHSSFAGLEYDIDSHWSVVGIKSSYSQVGIQLYEDITFSNLIKQSQWQNISNYIVFNWQELASPQDKGVKFLSQTGETASYNWAGHTPQIIEPFILYNKTHPANQTVDIFQIYLQQGTYYFDFGETSLGFAIYRPEGSGYYNFNEANAWSRGSSMGRKSFSYYANAPGWHALVVNSTGIGSNDYIIDIRDQVTWTGAVSTDWFDAGNWTSPIPPTEHYDVRIPSGAPVQPVISGSTLARAKSITVETGASINVSSGTLQVDNDLHLYGTMNLSGTSTQVWVYDSSVVRNGGSLTALNDAIFHCRGDWYSLAGSNVLFGPGSELRMGYNQQTAIVNHSTDLTIIQLTISNFDSGTVTLDALSTEDVEIVGTLTIFNGSKLYSESNHRLMASTIENFGSIQMDHGTLSLSGGAGIFPNNAGDYFHNVEINTVGTVTLDRDLTINGDLTINTGALSPGNRSIYIKGNWTNNASPGFIKGTSNVIFNGDEPQYCNGSSFYIITLLNDVHFTGMNTFIDKYQWYAGSFNLSGGNVLIQDLIQSSIVGKYVIEDGLLVVNQTGGSTDMNAELIIHGGEMRIYGGYSSSNWAAGGNAGLIMTSGVLDFADNGINIPNTTHNLDLQISGGLIRTVGNFVCQRSGFMPTAGAIELYGNTDTGFSMHPSSRIFDLIINKENSRVFITTNSTIEGNFMHQQGELWIGNRTFTINGEAEINGKLMMTGASGKLKVMHTLYWNNDSGSAINTGTIELQNRLEIAPGSVFQMGVNAILKFVGISSSPGGGSDIEEGLNYTRVNNQTAGTRFGNLIIDKVDWTDFEVLGNHVITVLGNMTVMGQSDVTLDAISVLVNGNLNNSAILKLVNNGFLQIDGDTTINGGNLYIGDNGFMECLGSFDHQVGSEMEIDTHGILSLARPYAGIYYSLAGNATIYENGTLEILHNGFQIGTDNINLDGGTLQIGWAFRAMNPNTFNGGTGTVEFTGPRAGQIEMHSTNSFYDLVINKPSIGFSVMQVTQAVASRDIIIQGGNLMPMSNILRALRDLKIEGGRLSLATGSVVQIARNWINDVGSSAFDEGTGTVQFVDTGGQNSVIPTETFHNLVINKAVDHYAVIPAGETVTIRGNLNIAFRKLILNPGATLKMNDNASLLIGASGELYAVGNQSYPVTISADTGYYSFQTNSGSKISAQYCIFERMNADGINLAAGSILDTNHPFSYCTFQNGAAGGTLLKKYNAQGLIMEDPVFPSNTWNGTHNVYHAAGDGHLIIRNATGGFAGAAYEDDPDDNIIWTFYSNNPNVAHSPQPPNNSSGIEPSANLGWTYTSHPSFANPVGYIVKMGTDPALTTYSESYISGGPGTYSIAPLISLSIGNTYYWQVIPTTEPEDRGSLTSRNIAGQVRGNATNCPIWNFTVSETIISSFPYYEDFESGPGAWYGGAETGPNIWEWGEPNYYPITTYSDSYVWATLLNANYPNNANSWLRSPTFDFSTVTAPSFSVWLHLNIELNYDGMILEYSTDGTNWTKVSGDPGFYNNTSSSGPLAPPKWSGEIGSWVQYSTAIPELANQSQAYLRFRFVSDGSVVKAGVGVEDIEIWDADYVPSFDWEEDFAGLSNGTIPAGWQRTNTNWGANSSVNAGGTAPEMRFSYIPQVTGDSYLKTPGINTTGFSNLNLSFKHMLDHYSGAYTLKLVSLVGSSEYVLREWINPTGNIPAETVNQSISAAQGAGASNLQIAWIFSGDSGNIDYWYIDDVLLESATAGPGVANSPAPYDGASNVPLTTTLGWAYSSQFGYPEPIGYRLRIGTSPGMTSFTESYISGGPGYYTVDVPIALQYGTSYYWQVIPTTDEDGSDVIGFSRSAALQSSSTENSRGDAAECLIWNFTTVPMPPISEFPYMQWFESGYDGWTSGAVSGNDHWQLGYPSQTVISSPYGGANAWMTYLDQNYENNANTWLKSPVFDFSELDEPNLSVWLNIWSEASYDGMILEYSFDNSSWNQVTGDTGFYNQMSLPAPSHPNWSGRMPGTDGIWTQYSSSLPLLANQSQVWFRFRFTSDGDFGAAYVDEGIALDDFRIWNTIDPPATAHSPEPEDGAIDVPLQTHLGWTYTSQPGYTDPVVYEIRFGTDPTMSTYGSTVLWGGPGTHSIQPSFSMSYGQTYYWQVIPSASGENYRGRQGSGREISREQPELQFSKATSNRSTAENCPIWSFTVVSDTSISSFPYFEDFEISNGNWRGGSITGLNIWQYGEPNQTVINSAYSGDYVWMTNLNGDYMNNADIWLRSPRFDFSALSEPIFSVWINHKTQPDYDGMILEASTDGGNSWFYMEANNGFYNNISGLGPISDPKWSGDSNGWSQFSISLAGLAHQPSVRLRFRFASNESLTDEGIAIDDIRIWNNELAIFAIDPVSHDFGRVEVNQSSSTQNFQISNTGAGILYLSPENISLVGMHPAEFELFNLSTPVELGAGQNTVIGISFTPVSMGEKNALLSIQEGSVPVRNSTLQDGNRSQTREHHLIPISGFGYQLITVNVPYYEGFSIEDEEDLPPGWESSNTNWWVSGTNQAGGEIPELLFSFDPQNVGEVTLLTPLFDTSGLSQIQLSLKHKVDHLNGTFDLKLFAVAGTTSYLIEEWLNVDSDIAENLNYILTDTNHGVGASDLRLAWIFNGDSYNINGWYLDDIILGGEVPVVITEPATEITHYEAELNALITSTGDLPIQAKGFYYSTDPDPATEGSQILSDSAEDSFSVLIEELVPATEYYFIAFADNPRGRAWGSVLSFNTISPELIISSTVLPDFGLVLINTTSAAQSFTISGANLLDDVTIEAPAGFSLGTDTERNSGRLENQIILEPLDGNLAETTILVYFQPTDIGAYTGDISIATDYADNDYIALSGSGIDYATVSVNAVSEISQTTATSGGNVTSDGNSAVIAKGLCWSTEEEPDLDDSNSNDGEGLGEFISYLSDLQPGTLYYVRAYATNGAGTSYSNQLSFTTETLALAIPQNVSISITDTTVNLSWDAVPNATSYRVYWSSSAQGGFIEDTSGTFDSNSWSAPISGEKRFYHVRSVAE